MIMTNNSLIQDNYYVVKSSPPQFIQGATNVSQSNNVENNQNYNQGRWKGPKGNSLQCQICKKFVHTTTKYYFRYMSSKNNSPNTQNVLPRDNGKPYRGNGGPRANVGQV